MRFTGFEAPAKYNRPPVLVLGDVLVDHVYEVEQMPTPGGDATLDRAERHPGGAGLNTACGLAGLGIDCLLASCVGEDEQGEYLRGVLHGAGVGVGLLKQSGVTGHVISLVDRRGERTMLSFRGSCGEPAAVSASASSGSTLRQTPLLFVSGYGLQEPCQAESYLEAARMVKTAGGRVAFDPTPVVSSLLRDAIREMLALTDILLPNEAELLVLAGTGSLDTAIARLAKSVACLGVKLGGRGSLTVTPAGEQLASPASALEVVDTTGAGDAFNAGFLAALLYDLPPQAWGDWGNRLAARVVAKRGAGV